MSKTTIREAIEKIVSLAERDKRRPVIGELLAGGELWSDLDFDATDRETLAIFGLVELVENALEKRSSSPEERARAALGGFAREGRAEKRLSSKGAMYTLAKKREKRRAKR